MARLARSRLAVYARVLLVLYGIVLVVVLFSPSSSVQSSLVYHLTLTLQALGSPPGWVTYQRMEVVMNALIIAPVSFLSMLIFRRLRWQDCAAYAFMGSASVELIQGVALPQRQASFSDIVANTSGGLLGALLALLVLIVLRRMHAGTSRAWS